MSQAAGRDVYLATLDEQIIRTFEKHHAFLLFTDKGHVAEVVYQPGFSPLFCSSSHFWRGAK